MTLKSIQLATISPQDRARQLFTVDVHSDDGTKGAIFRCTGEREALHLRDAIRYHADALVRTFDYDKPTVGAMVEPDEAMAALLISDAEWDATPVSVQWKVRRYVKENAP